MGKDSCCTNSSSHFGLFLFWKVRVVVVVRCQFFLAIKIIPKITSVKLQTVVVKLLVQIFFGNIPFFWTQRHWFEPLVFRLDAMTWQMIMPLSGWRQDGKIELLRSTSSSSFSLCLKSDLQPNSCWFQFFSFSRAQGGLEVYYGHICPGNSTKNSIFVSFHQFLKRFPMILETLRGDWISHACYSFRKFWKTQHIIGSSVLTAQCAYLTQDNRFPSCLHFICNRI